VHQSRASKRHYPHRLCAEALLPLPSSVSSASAFSLRKWLDPNDHIPSPAALGASRSHHRPSLHRGPCLAPPYRAATPPHSRPPPSVSPASALVAQRPPGVPHELTSNTLPLASTHRAIGERTSVRGLCAVTTPPARQTRAQSRGHAGRQPEAQLAFRPASRGRPPRLAL
jgi:hypothetical protein